jgi:hypothetical protein
MLCSWGSVATREVVRVCRVRGSQMPAFWGGFTSNLSLLWCYLNHVEHRATKPSDDQDRISNTAKWEETGPVALLADSECKQPRLWEKVSFLLVVDCREGNCLVILQRPCPYDPWRGISVKFENEWLWACPSSKRVSFLKSLWHRKGQTKVAIHITALLLR